MSATGALPIRTTLSGVIVHDPHMASFAGLRVDTFKPSGWDETDTDDPRDEATVALYFEWMYVTWPIR